MKFRAGYVGLIGLPNAGKSTLLNAVVGEKVAIVTPKPQTTRGRVVGLVTTKTAQVCFNDAPGLIRAEKGLNKFLAQEFTDVIDDSDVLVAVLNLDEKQLDRLLEVVELVKAAGRPWIALITKTDLPLERRLPILKSKLLSYGVPIVSGSAEKDPKEIRSELLREIEAILPESPGPLFDSSLYTTQSVREMATELIREQCFLQLHEEIPFSMVVRLRTFDESSRTIKIDADLIVSKETHRGMVIGLKGQKLKSIGQSARLEIEKLVGQKIFLGLHVTAKAKWYENPRMMKEFGYGIEPS